MSTQVALTKEQEINISSSFNIKNIEIQAYTQQYGDIIVSEITPELCEKAKELGKKLVKIRTAIDSIHAVEKNYFLRAGQFVDALKKKMQEPVIQMEFHLKSIANHYENIEKERLEAIRKTRSSLLLKIGTNAPVGIETMSEVLFEALLKTAEKDFNNRQIKIKEEADKQAQDTLVANRYNKFRKYMYLVPVGTEVKFEKMDDTTFDRLVKKYEKLYLKDQASKAAIKTEVVSSDDQKLMQKWLSEFKFPPAPIDNEKTRAVIEKYKEFMLYAVKLIS